MADRTPDPEVAAWMDAWLLEMRVAGYNRAYMRLAVNEWGMLTIGWETDPAALYDESGPGHGEDDAWRIAIRAFVDLDHLRPAHITQTLLVGMILAGDVSLEDL